MKKLLNTVKFSRKSRYLPTMLQVIRIFSHNARVCMAFLSWIFYLFSLKLQRFWKHQIVDFQSFSIIVRYEFKFMIKFWEKIQDFIFCFLKVMSAMPNNTLTATQFQSVFDVVFEDSVKRVCYVFLICIHANNASINANNVCINANNLCINANNVCTNNKWSVCYSRYIVILPLSEWNCQQ